MADPNIALNKTATASNYVMPYSPSKAVNGSVTTFSRWLSNTVPAAMVVDLGSVNVITAWTVKHMSVAGWATPDYNMVDYALQGSNNNSTWITIDSVTNNTAGITSRSVIAAYRYVRLYVTKGLRTNPQFASIMELEINGHPVTAKLTALGISSGALVPAFSSQTLAYNTANVPYTTSSVTVTATPEDATSVIRVNGVVMTGGQSVVNLNVGSNTINVLVTAIDGVTTNNYTITVIREQGAVLTGLSISSGSLIPGFSSNVLEYTTQNVGYDTSSVSVTPTTTVAGTTITVAGNPAVSGQPSPVNLAVGSNTINIVATNGAASQTYTITVVRNSSPYLTKVDVTYKSGKTSTVTTVNIVSGQLEYNADIPNSITSVTITPYSQDTNAKINVNGNQSLGNGQISVAIPIVVGTTSIPIIVTSSIGSETKTYGISMT